MAHRESRGIAVLFLEHGTGRGMRDQLHAPPVLYPRKRPGTHCTGGWVGPRADLDRCGKSRPPPGFDPRTVQPVASRYTDWATRPTLCKVVVRNTILQVDFHWRFCYLLARAEKLGWHACSGGCTVVFKKPYTASASCQCYEGLLRILRDVRGFCGA